MRRGYGLSILLAGALLAAPVMARAQSTTWIAGTGDWSAGSNWSVGEPTAGVDAIFNTPGMATVTESGEACRSLLMGATGGALLDLTGGSLTVDNATVGTAANLGASLATSAIGNPVLTVAHSLTIGRVADVVAGGGTITIGTTSADSLVVLGTFQMMNSAPAISVTNLAMRDQSVLSAFVQFTGLTGLVSSGAAVLNGTLKVFDFAAPDGTYEIVRAATLVGTFDAVELPAFGSWSWRIEGNSVFVTKGTVAVAASTWSGVKSQYAR